MGMVSSSVLESNGNKCRRGAKKVSRGAAANETMGLATFAGGGPGGSAGGGPGGPGGAASGTKRLAAFESEYALGTGGEAAGPRTLANYPHCQMESLSPLARGTASGSQPSLAVAPGEPLAQACTCSRHTTSFPHRSNASRMELHFVPWRSLGDLLPKCTLRWEQENPGPPWIGRGPQLCQRNTGLSNRG